MGKETTPLLKTKFHTPPQRTNLVLRPRLMARMGESLYLPRRLTLISARAGSGKTTLVSEWLHQQEQPSAWLSLDGNDNDPWRFFRYLVEALQQMGVTISQAGLSKWEQLDLSSAETLITGLINAITASSIPLILVLDDYHYIQNDWIHKAIGYLIEYQPPELHLIFTTRVDPPFPLAQLRARNQLTEIRDRDLLFTADEATEFLNKVMELNLPDNAVATIEMRTEGWIAGLQMAAISAQGHKQDGSLDAFIDAFAGTNRFILDYLTEEVLNRQSPLVQDFLIETSILKWMCGDLCDAVRPGEAAKGDNQAILVQLERTNLFVIPLDDERRWYRYHHLFADLLQSVLRQRRSAEQIRELHRRAGKWYEGNEQWGEAMAHIMDAQDFEHAASMIDENIVGLFHMFTQDKEPLLLNWIGKLPEEIKRGRPWIDVYRANLLALNLQLDDVEPILDDVEKRVEPDSPRASEILGHVAAVRAYSANLRGDAARAISMSDLAKKYLPGDGYPAMQGMAAFTLADTYFASDDMEGASRSLLDLLKIGEKTGQLMFIIPALCDLAAIQKVRGRLYLAREHYDKAYQWMLERNGLDMRVRCSYEFGMADLLREQNQLDAAREHAITGIELRRQLGGYMMIGDLTLMRVLQARGDVEGAMKALRDAEQAVQTHPFQMAMMIEFKTARVIQWLNAGNVAMASRWVKECGNSEQEQIARARLWLAQGLYEDAQRLLDQQGLLAETGDRMGRLIEILALKAIALDSLGQPDEADAALFRAFSLSQPEGYLRIFLDLGLPLRILLERTPMHGAGVDEQVKALRNAFQLEGRSDAIPLSLSSTEALIDPLTGRELEILHLLAEGLSNKEIAYKLVVAPGTIKQHLKNICRKLEVHGRMQAVKRGRELNLL